MLAFSYQLTSGYPLTILESGNHTENKKRQMPIFRGFPLEFVIHEGQNRVPLKQRKRSLVRLDKFIIHLTPIKENTR